MDNKTREHYRTLLIALQAELQAAISAPTSTGKSVAPDNAIGRLSRMEALQSQAMSQAGTERLKKRLRAVELALKAVDDASYGTCIRCAEPIPEGRLEIVPESRVCVACARRG